MATPPPPPLEDAPLRRVVVRPEAEVALAGLVRAADALGDGVVLETTGFASTALASTALASTAFRSTAFTSTVLLAAAELRVVVLREVVERVVRRRGVGEGVAMEGKGWKRNGSGGRSGAPYPSGVQ